MITFTEKIENENKYKCIATIQIEFEVKGYNEGDAGYNADNYIENLPGYIAHEIQNISKIDE